MNPFTIINHFYFHFSYIEKHLFILDIYAVSTYDKMPLYIHTVNFFTSGRVLQVYFHRGNSYICPSIHNKYVCISFPFANLSIYQQISFNICRCIYTKNGSLGIINGQILIISHRVMALFSVQKLHFGLLVPLLQSNLS